MKPQKIRNTAKKSIFHESNALVIRIVWFAIGIIILFAVAVAFFAPLVSAAKKLDYFDYVSELRSNVLTAETEEFSLRAFAVEKEYPYAADGVKREMTKRAEIYLTAPAGDELAHVNFQVGGEKYGGEMSYDNVKEEYFFSVSADLSKADTVDFFVEYGKEQLTFHAVTVKKQTTLTPKIALDKLKENETELFSSLTDEHGFMGEIYLRLICEGEPYYYVGLITKDGKVRAFLLAADTGKVLAKRET